LLLALLLCTSRGAPAALAYSDSGAVPGARRLQSGEIGTTWTSTVPVTTVVDDRRRVWPISEHGVTVTFYLNSVTEPAWFTFTPQISDPLPGGYLPTPYFFRLDGTYQATGWPVSLNQAGIQLEVSYDAARLGEIDPRTLQFFHYGATEWLPQGGDIDLSASRLTLRTKRTQAFAIGGQPPKKDVYLPLVIRD
jgi:hypothetical protein